MTTSQSEPPYGDIEWLSTHSARLANSLARLTGKQLIPEDTAGQSPADWLFSAPFSIVSHGTEADPIFNYANRTALHLFEMNWQEFTELPSRKSAEPVHRDERARLMASVQSRGYIDNYGGIRISKTGRRFRIENAIVWNVLDEDGTVIGQAAMFDRWTPVE